MIQMFANDMTIFCEIQDDSVGVLLQDDAKALKKWSNDWLLRFNAEKCKVMHFGKPVTSLNTPRGRMTILQNSRKQPWRKTLLYI